jgi:hypothetical protein
VAFGAWRGADALGPLHHATEQAAVLLLHLLEHGEGALEAEFLGIGCVDAAHQRAGDLVEGFRAEAPADESGEAFVLIAGQLWERSTSMPMRSFPGQEMRRERRKGSTMVGAISIMPSGMGWRRPLLQT